MQNDYVAALAPFARTLSSDIPLINTLGRAAIVIVDVTANAGGLGSITVTLQGIDPTSGKKYTLIASAAITAVGTTVYRVGSGLTAAANLVANDVAPKNVNLNVTANNANPMTYSVGVHFIG